MKTLIKNARIISPGIDLPGAAVEIEGKTITAVYPAGSETPRRRQGDGCGRPHAPSRFH